jgi:hypothetical protein
MRPRRAHRNTSAPTACDPSTPLFEMMKLPANCKDVTTQKLGTTYTVVGYVQTDCAQD